MEKALAQKTAAGLTRYLDVSSTRWPTLLRWFRLGCVVVFLASSWAHDTTAREHTFTTFTNEDGLSQLSVTSLLQDREGYIWIGTQAGVNRFDGERFQSFGIRDGLAGDRVSALAEDPEGAVWIGSSKGLSRFFQGQLRTFSVADGLPDNHILSLTVTADGILWCGTVGGFARRRGDSFERLEALAGQSVQELLEDSSRRLWIGTSKGLFSWADGRLHEQVALRNRSISALTLDSSKRLWVATSSSLLAFEQDRQILELTSDDGLPDLNWSGVSLAAGRQGEIWIGTENGAAKWWEGKLTWFGADEGLPIIHVRSVLEDREGVLWFGGLGGLSRWIGRAFTTYTRKDGLPSINVRPVLRDSRGRLWAGTALGLGRWDGPGSPWTTYSQRNGLPHNYVLCLAEDPQGRVWVGTTGGLAYIDDQGIHRDPAWMSNRTVGALVLDSEGTLWLAVSSLGLAKGGFGTFEAVPVPDNTFRDPRVAIDSQDRVWVSGDLGLSHWNGEKWTTYGEKDGLAAPNPYWIEPDGEGGAWFGYFTSVGLTHFDGTSFRTFTTADGLANDSVYSLGLDVQGNLWVGSAGGVDRFNGHAFRNYGKVEGYASWESNAGGFFADPDGTLWMGTAEGLSHFDPRLDPAFDAPLLLRIDRPTLDGLPFGSDRRDFREGTTLKAEVSAVTSAHRRNLDLQYRLGGLHEAWQPLDHRDLELANLAAGTYGLEVRGRRYQEPWTEVRLPSFRVHPPFWRTPVFGLFSLVCAALMTIGLIRVRTARLQGRTQWLEEEVARRSLESEKARRAAEDANRAKSDFLAHMSHEIRTPLNAIIGLTSLLRNAELPDREAQQVETIEKSGRLLLTLISDVLDFSRIEAGHVSFESQPFDPRSTIRAAVDLVRPQALDKGLNVSLSISDEVPRSMVGDPTRFAQIIWNLLGNAIKFTRRGEVGLISTMKRSPDGSRLVLEIRDTGIGIPKDRQERIFGSFQQADASTTRKFGGTGLGLAITKHLVDLFGGDIQVQSSPGEGSVFTVELPCHEPETQPEPTPATDPQPPSHSSRGLSVLVVDDNPVNRLVAEAMLESLGHKAQLADDGQQAVAATREASFDLILMDIHMPALDGIDASRLIRENWSRDRLPIVAVTADVLEGTRERCLAAGMNEVLAKPVSRQELKDLIKDLGLKDLGIKD